MDDSAEIARAHGLVLSPWFRCSEPPVRVGVYEVSTQTAYLGWTWWDGERWGDCYPYQAAAASNKAQLYRARPFHWVREWRGLIPDPTSNADFKCVCSCG